MLYVEHLEINRVCITHINKSINSPIFQAVAVEGSTKLCVLMCSLFCFVFFKIYEPNIHTVYCFNNVEIVLYH